MILILDPSIFVAAACYKTAIRTNKLSKNIAVKLNIKILNLKKVFKRSPSEINAVLSPGRMSNFNISRYLKYPIRDFSCDDSYKEWSNRKEQLGRNDVKTTHIYIQGKPDLSLHPFVP